MNKYVAILHFRRTVIEAETALEAQKKAARYFRARKPHTIVIVLNELSNGQMVRVDPAAL